jgi:hypothetical protein
MSTVSGPSNELWFVVTPAGGQQAGRSCQRLPRDVVGLPRVEREQQHLKRTPQRAVHGGQQRVAADRRPRRQSACQIERRRGDFPAMPSKVVSYELARGWC